MSNFVHIKVTYNFSSLEATAPIEMPMIALFYECKMKLRVKEDSEDALFWHFRPIEINNMPIGKVDIDVSKPIFLIISKEKYEKTEKYMNNVFPSLVYESSKIENGHILILEKLTTLYSCYKRIEDTETIDFVKQILPKKRFDINDPHKKLESLLKWFTNEYFKKYEFPICERCNKQTDYCGNGPVLLSELDGFPLDADHYMCPTCGSQERFPRFQKPTRLLKNKYGKCREHIIAFGAILHALGFSFRFVTDFTEQEWIEVWSETESRYIHIDPFVEAFDAPLLYETGWMKDIIWVVAINSKECFDVTKRYTSRFDSVISSRNAFLGEEIFQKLITYRNIQWMSIAKPKDKDLIIKRQQLDFIQMLNENRIPHENEKQQKQKLNI